MLHHWEQSHVLMNGFSQSLAMYTLAKANKILLLLPEPKGLG